MMRFFLFTLIFFLFTHFSFSQAINIESKRIYDTDKPWAGNIDVSFYAMQTKDPLWGFKLKPQVQYKDSLNSYLVVADLNQQKGKNLTFASTGMLHFRYSKRLYKGPVKWESYVQSQFNRLLLQKNRTILGSGLRWKYRDTDGVKLFLGTSLMYEYEEINPNNKNIYYNNRVRMSYYNSWFIKSKESNYSFNGTIYYQPVFAHYDNWRFTTQFELAFRMSQNTNFKFDIMLFYDSKPAPLVRNWIYNTSFGMTYKFI